NAIALGARAGGGGDRGADRALPDRLYVRERGGGSEGGGEAFDGERQWPRCAPAHRATSRASAKIAPSPTRSRVTDASPAPGTCARSVVAITLWPSPARSPANSSR